MTGLNYNNSDDLPADFIQFLKEDFSEYFDDCYQVEFGCIESSFNSYENFRNSVIKYSIDNGVDYKLTGRTQVDEALLEMCDTAGIDYDIVKKDENRLIQGELAGIISANVIKPEELNYISMEVIGDEEPVLVCPDSSEQIYSEGMLVQKGSGSKLDIEQGPEFETPELIFYAITEYDELFFYGGLFDEIGNLDNVGNEFNSGHHLRY